MGSYTEIARGSLGIARGSHVIVWDSLEMARGSLVIARVHLKLSLEIAREIVRVQIARFHLKLHGFT